MTAARRTLEEIEALAAEATPGPWGTMGRTVGVNPENPMTWSGIAMVAGYGPQSDANLHMIAALPDLLAIAQGQREELEKWRHLGETIHAHWRDGRIQTNPDGVCMCGSEKQTGHEGHQFTDMVDYYVGKTFDDLEKLIGTKK